MSVSLAVLKKVRLVELKLRRRVKDLLVGGYRSAFKGQGMVFSDHRRYVPGDDIRAISWPLTAKIGEPYIKIFEEEKGATFIIAMDVSGSFDFGTNNFKGEVASELASLIILSAQRQQDSVGLLLFSDRVEHYVPPAQGSKHILRIVRDLYSFKRNSCLTNITSALDFLNKVLKKRCHIFLFSDFFTSSDFTKTLKITRRRHDIVVSVVRDCFEDKIPSLGLITLQDSETGEQKTIDTSSFIFKRQYTKQRLNQKQKIKDDLHQSGVDHFFINTNQDIFKQLMVFMKKRREK